MFINPFEVNGTDVNLQGYTPAKTTEIHGANCHWRLWSRAGGGYQSGRDYKYGASQHYIVLTHQGKMIGWTGFELGTNWRKGRPLLSGMVDKLNALDIDFDSMTTDEIYFATRQYFGKLSKDSELLDEFDNPVGVLRTIYDSFHPSTLTHPCPAIIYMPLPMDLNKANQ